jgi:hypothetical protein
MKIGRDHAVQAAAIHAVTRQLKAFEAQTVASATTIFSKGDDHTRARQLATGHQGRLGLCMVVYNWVWSSGFLGVSEACVVQV